MYIYYLDMQATFQVVAKEFPLHLNCKHFPPKVVGNIGSTDAHTHTKHTRLHLLRFLLCFVRRHVVHLPLQIRILTP